MPRIRFETLTVDLASVQGPMISAIAFFGKKVILHELILWFCNAVQPRFERHSNAVAANCGITDGKSPCPVQTIDMIMVYT